MGFIKIRTLENLVQSWTIVENLADSDTVLCRTPLGNFVRLKKEDLPSALNLGSMAHRDIWVGTSLEYEELAETPDNTIYFIIND
jgi:hypothetical protein